VIGIHWGIDTELFQNLTLSLDFGKETETSLTLCLEKSKEQQDVIVLTENAYKECQKQGAQLT